MKFLIDIGHPAHIHYWRNFAEITAKNGNEVIFTTRDKEITIDLLEHYGYNYRNLGKPYKGFRNKLKGLATFNYKLWKIASEFKPDIFLSAGSPYAAMVSSFQRKPHITLEDTFNFEQIKIYRPFTNVILTGDYEHPALGGKEIKYSGYQELAYLHPNYFKPDKSILNELGAGEEEKYVILRFVSWQATHDVGHKGISYENKMKAIKSFEKHAKVFISSEAELPAELESYRIKIDPSRMHDAIAFASLVMGESFTMLSEAAVLGIPSVLIHNTSCYYLREQQERYGLTFNYTESEEDQIKAIEKGSEILADAGGKRRREESRRKLLSEKIDVTAFLVWFVENYPESKKIMIKNPGYQQNFK